MEQAPLAITLREIETLIAWRRFADAEDRALRAIAYHPRNPAVWFLLGHSRQQRHNIDGARKAANQGLLVAPADKPLRVLSIELDVQTGKLAAALKDLRALAAEKGHNESLLLLIARLFTRLNLHAEADRCHRQALEKAPENVETLLRLANSTMAFGNAEEAERLLNQVIAAAPRNYDAYYNRAIARKQTASCNHVAQIERLLSQPSLDANGEIVLCHALAKELEDIGEYRRSFAVLKRGADMRRRTLRYRVEDDVSAMQEVSTVFNRDFFARDMPGEQTPKPIFILGLPRSGTTLLDRILSSHSQVESLGEVNRFAGILMRAARRSNDKFDLIAQSAQADLASVGRTYAEIASAIGTGTARFIDKTPLNFVYLGAIARALPNATIVHVRRNAMDVCYAIYKTLFSMVYAFSYDLSDLARYYLAYDKLMAHWRAMQPGRLIEVRYEDVVANQEYITRRLIADCGLDWEDVCLTPERNDGPSLTASAAQVRRKIYSSSIGLWRAYEKELQPLVRTLQENGISIDEA